MTLLRRCIDRLRHNRGYGVQSPAAFHFVMHVLREGKHRYYPYEYVNSVAKQTAEHSPAHCRRLFRIANALHPTRIILLDNGKGCARKTFAAACTSIDIHSCTSLEEFTRELNDKSRQMLYIGDTQDYAKAVEKAIPQMEAHSVIIIEGIRSTAQKRAWWRETIANKSVVVSMDLYNTGLLFFNTRYRKQHYTFWFK